MSRRIAPPAPVEAAGRRTPRPAPADAARPRSLARLGTYRIDRSYEWNYAHGPVWAGEWPAVPDTPTKRFFGYEVASRLGISAGLLLNSAWIDFYARCGFDILTYKTVRSRRRACYPKPNWLFVDDADARRLDRLDAASGARRPNGAERAGRAKRTERAPAAVHARTRPPAAGGYADWTSSVSFGMPSRDPAVWMPDVAKARDLLGARQVLVVSVVASPADGASAADIVRDFGDLAAMAREAGAQAVEANLSCPNVHSAEGDLYHDAALSGRIAGALRQGAGSLPVLLKIGHLADARRMAALLRAVAGRASGLVIVNGLSRPVLDAGGAPAYGAERRQAGILGRGVHPIGVRDVARAVEIIRRERLDLEVAGVGGIANADDAGRYFAAGANAALMGSAPMFDPAIAARLKTSHPEW
jgi:dihydroorotate dehydrogenase